MKYTLNAVGQAAIVQFLENVKCVDRPWSFFDRAERSFNGPRGPSMPVLFVLLGVDAREHRLTLEHEWFDSTPEPATFDEVVAMLRCAHEELPLLAGVKIGQLWTSMGALLARCPGGLKAPTGPVVPMSTVPLEAPFMLWDPAFMSREPFASWPAGLKAPDRVEIHFRGNPAVHSRGFVSDYAWDHQGTDVDIVAYRKA